MDADSAVLEDEKKSLIRFRFKKGVVSSRKQCGSQCEGIDASTQDLLHHLWRSLASPFVVLLTYYSPLVHQVSRRCTQHRTSARKRERERERERYKKDSREGRGRRKEHPFVFAE